MVGRFLAMVAGIGGLLAGSQAPEFTVQYMQNLTGRIAELKPLVEQFDADVAAYGYTREQAMTECATADGLLDALCNGYETSVRRYERLTAHFATLEAATDLARPLTLARSYERDIVDSVLEQYKPAIPTTLDGAVYAGGGFAVLWGGLSFIFGLLGAMTGGRRYA